MKPGWRELIFIIMLGLVPLGAWAYINLPRKAAQKRMDNEHIDLVRMITQTNTSKDEAKASVTDAIQRLERLLGASMKHLIEDFEIGHATSDIRKLAVENKLQPGYQNLGGPYPLPGTKIFQAYSFKLIKIRGRYEDFRRFLQQLNGLGYRIWIPTALVRRAGNSRIAPKAGEVAEDLIEAELEVKILVPTETNNSKGKGNERGKQNTPTAPMADELRAAGPRTAIQ